MNVENFKYDGKLASDFGLIVCHIGGAPGEETINAGSDINFNQVSIRHGNKFLITDTTYDSVIETTFQVCKFSCETKVFEPLTLDEKRKIARWLQRKESHVLELVDEKDEDASRYIFEGSFNGLSEVFYYGECIGYELRFITNRPYAIGKTITRTIIADTENFEYMLTDSSDEVGYIYPNKMTITFNEDVEEFNLYNYIEDSTNGRLTQIKNCKKNEVITFDDNLIISTSNEEHKKTLQDDFNFHFFRIANSYSNRINKLSISHPCVIKIEYNPVVKGVGL